MPKRFHNWTYRQVKTFLEKHKFILVDITGSHHFFSGNINNTPRTAVVPFHGAKSLNIKTMKSIVDQSGIPEKEWLS